LTDFFILSHPDLPPRTNSGLKLANAFGVFVLKFQTDALLDAALA
jgi:hypothetical protein